jgi:hypothetical protein
MMVVIIGKSEYLSGQFSNHMASQAAHLKTILVLAGA